MLSAAAAVLGSVLSLLFSVFPGLSSWFAQVGENEKRVLMLGALALLSVGMLALVCSGSSIEGFVCTRDAALSLLLSFFSMATANQVTYALTPRSTVKLEPKQANSKLALYLGIVLVVFGLMALLALLAFVVPAG